MDIQENKIVLFMDHNTLFKVDCMNLVENYLKSWEKSPVSSGFMLAVSGLSEIKILQVELSSVNSSMFPSATLLKTQMEVSSTMKPKLKSKEESRFGRKWG